MLLISDEAHFHLNESVNKQKCQCYAKENTHLIHEKVLHSPCVTAWCGVLAEWRIIGPHFFDDNVNDVCYTKMIDEFLLPDLTVVTH